MAEAGLGDPAPPPPRLPSAPRPAPPLMVQLTGDLWVPVDGIYTLFLTSRASSRLYLDGSLTLDTRDCEGGWLNACLGREKWIEFWMAGGRWHPLR